MKVILIISWFFIGCDLMAQKTQKDSIASATEFTIPRSGAFTLLGNNPSDVSTPGFTKDIKLDYFLDKFTLKPNIAFEFQPFWLFAFKNVTLEDYKKIPPLVRFLGTANFSLGTVQDNDSINRIAYSMKFTFQKDPMMDGDYLNSIQKALDESQENLQKKAFKLSMRIQFLNNKNDDLDHSLDELKKSRKIFMTDSLKNAKQIAIIDDEIKKADDQISQNNQEIIKVETQNADITTSTQKELDASLKKIAKDYIERNWASPKMDIGIGKINTYKDPEISKIKFNDKGFGIWVNPSFGFAPAKWFKKNINADASYADKIIITALFKYIKTDSLKQNYYGGNLKYGSSKINLFVEYISKGDKNIKTTTNTVTQTIAYGGCYTIGTKKLIEFGLRTGYDKDFKFKSLKPVISFNWKLGKDALQ